jgi:diphthine-ammonia ligase
MSMPSPQSLAAEVTLASQHADRIIKALSSSAGGGGGRWDDGHAQLILYWAVEERHISHAITAAQRLDVSLQRLLWTRPIILFLQRDATPTLFLVVSCLPKGALIEKQVLYHTGRGFSAAGDGNEDDTAAPVSFPASYGTGIAWFPIKRTFYLNWIRHRSILRRRY